MQSAEWIIRRVREHPGCRIAVVGLPETAVGFVREILENAGCPPDNLLTRPPELRWNNGSSVLLVRPQARARPSLRLYAARKRLEREGSIVASSPRREWIFGGLRKQPQ